MLPESGLPVLILCHRRQRSSSTIFAVTRRRLLDRLLFVCSVTGVQLLEGPSFGPPVFQGPSISRVALLILLLTSIFHSGGCV